MQRPRRSIDGVKRVIALPSIAAAIALVVSACGGGFYVGIGGDFGNAPPSVSLAAAVTSVQAGQTVRLVAAAADDDAIDNVAFYRVDAGGAVLLGTLDASADGRYEWHAVMPADGRTSFTTFARATDSDGNRTDSAWLTLPAAR